LAGEAAAPAERIGSVPAAVVGFWSHAAHQLNSTNRRATMPPNAGSKGEANSGYRRIGREKYGEIGFMR
jgi:hypothetical protein